MRIYVWQCDNCSRVFNNPAEEGRGHINVNVKQFEVFVGYPRGSGETWARCRVDHLGTEDELHFCHGRCMGEYLDNKIHEHLDRFSMQASTESYEEFRQQINKNMINFGILRGMEEVASPGPEVEMEPEPPSLSDFMDSNTEAILPAAREATEFLTGDNWYDKTAWERIWERERIDHPLDWLEGVADHVLEVERSKLEEHPALLAGCRRRWIVLCGYAGGSVTRAAEAWTSTNPRVGDQPSHHTGDGHAREEPRGMDRLAAAEDALKLVAAELEMIDEQSEDEEPAGGWDF